MPTSKQPRTTQLQSQPLEIHVYFVVLEGSLGLDLTGPAEALRIANRVLAAQDPNQQAAKLFEVHHVGFADSAVLSTGMMVSQLEPMPNPQDLLAATLAWVVILGQEGIEPLDPQLPQNKQLITWLKDIPLKKDHIEIITVCAGSLFLGYAGLLKGRKVTTHHLDLDELARIAPDCHLQQDCVFVEDSAIASSAGVTTGIDLMVHKIAQVCGEVVASEVAQWLVMPQRRSAKHSQFSDLLSHRAHLHPAVHRVQAAITLEPKADWTVQGLAEIAHVSSRHLGRLFKEHTDISVMQYVTLVRLSLAKSALAAGLRVTEAADIAGFGSDVQLRRAWHQFNEPGTPSTYHTASLTIDNSSTNDLPINNSPINSLPNASSKDNR